MKPLWQYFCLVPFVFQYFTIYIYIYIYIFFFFSILTFGILESQRVKPIKFIMMTIQQGCSKAFATCSIFHHSRKKKRILITGLTCQNKQTLAFFQFHSQLPALGVNLFAIFKFLFINITLFLYFN